MTKPKKWPHEANQTRLEAITGIEKTLNDLVDARERISHGETLIGLNSIINAERRLIKIAIALRDAGFVFRKQEEGES